MGARVSADNRTFPQACTGSDGNTPILALERILDNSGACAAIRSALNHRLSIANCYSRTMTRPLRLEFPGALYHESVARPMAQ